MRFAAATKFCCRDKDFHKNSPVHTNVAAACCVPQRVAGVAETSRLTSTLGAICPCDVSPQRVAATRSRLTCIFGVICRRELLLPNLIVAKCAQVQP